MKSYLYVSYSLDVSNGILGDVDQTVENLMKSEGYDRIGSGAGFGTRDLNFDAKGEEFTQEKIDVLFSKVVAAVGSAHSDLEWAMSYDAWHDDERDEDGCIEELCLVAELKPLYTLRDCPMCHEAHGEDKGPQLTVTSQIDLNTGRLICDAWHTVKCQNCGLEVSEEYAHEVVRRWNGESLLDEDEEGNT